MTSNHAPTAPRPALSVFPRSPARALLLVVALVGCSKTPPAEKQGQDLGEPVGAQLPATSKLPAMSVAFAVSKGQDPVPLLAPFVGLLSQSAIACPTFVRESSQGPSDVSSVDFTIVAGKLKPSKRSDPTPGFSCLLAALDGKDLGAPSAQALSGRAEIKIDAGDAATAKP